MRNQYKFFILSALAMLVFGIAGFFLAKHLDTSAASADHSMHSETANLSGPLSVAVGKYRLTVNVLGRSENSADDANRIGSTLLQVTVRDRKNQPVEAAMVRVAAQRKASGTVSANHGAGHGHATSTNLSKQMGSASDDAIDTELVRFESDGPGIYRGALSMRAEGEYLLAVDVSSTALGHGDLVLAYRAGGNELRVAAATPEGVAYYTCAMHGSVREAGPGSCPICGMDLVPVTQEEVSSGVITIDARRRQLIGVKTAIAGHRDLHRTIRAVGKVSFDERRISTVSLKFDAWIGDLKADFVGKQVQRGQVLFSAYSPELLSAQQEYLETRQRLARRGPDDSLLQAARRRLMLWDISAEQVAALERRGKPIEYMPIFAPHSGTVVEKMVVEGSHIKTGDPLLRIADLSRVWVDAEVYEADLPSIKPGMSASVTLPYLPGVQIDATVDYIYPYLEAATRTARIRLELDNPIGELKPDMYAEVKLQSDLGHRLAIPEEAVLVAGETRIVFRDLGEDGKLKPVRVRTGARADGYIVIEEGLTLGDTVVTSGNFLIASEARLKTGAEQW